MKLLPASFRHGAIWELLGSTAQCGIQESLLAKKHQSRKSGVSPRNPPHKQSLRDLCSSGSELIREAVEAHGQKLGMPDQFHVHDVTGRIAGVGSLGVRRYLALLEGEGPPDGYRLLDIKQVEPSALVGSTNASQPDYGGDDAHSGSCRPRPCCGAIRPRDSRRAAHIGPYACRIREMIPEDNRSSLDRFRRQPAKLREAVRDRRTAHQHGRTSRRPAGVGPKKDQKQDHWPELADWSNGAAIDAALAAAARYRRAYKPTLRRVLRVRSRRGWWCG